MMCRNRPWCNANSFHLNFAISPLFCHSFHPCMTYQIVRKAMTYMEHDRCMSYRTNHLLLALEQFAAEVRQQQLLPEYLEDAIEESGDDKDENGEDEEAEWKEDGDSDDGNEDKAAEDTMEELVDMEREDYDEEAMEEQQQDGQEKEEGATDADANALSTPIYDEIFPPVAAIGAQCLSREILAKTWNDTGNRFYRSDLDVTGADRDAFYGKVNDSLNAYIATMLLEPRSLDSAFAKVDD